MIDQRTYTTYSETDLLNRIERRVSCALLSLGPKTGKSAPWYLLSVTLRTGEAHTFAGQKRRDVLIQAVAALEADEWEQTGRAA